MAKKTPRKRTGKKAITRKKPAAAKQASGIESLSIAEIQSELRRRQSGSEKLLRKRDRLMQQIAEIDAEIAAVGLSMREVGGGRRRRNAKSLVDAMTEVLDGVELSVTELADAVQRAGYATTSPNFRTIVNQTLIKHKKLFKRVRRGVYTAK